MITVAILTKDNEETLRDTLESVKDFSEVILLDTGSTDSTLEIASQFANVKIFKSPFKGFGELRNLAASFASHDWILSVDSDEKLSPSLASELLRLTPAANTLYSFPFHNVYNNKHIKGCGWHPDRHIRLYNRQTTGFTLRAVHEALQRDHHAVVPLSSPIIHESYRSIADFSRKMHLYSDLFAQEYAGKKRSSFSKALSHAIFAFFKSYLLKRGLLLGKEGFIISFYNGETAFYKYLKLHEANKKC